jgi:hypothetical protein
MDITISASGIRGAKDPRGETKRGRERVKEGERAFS